jgi:hypothetical protein
MHDQQTIDHFIALRAKGLSCQRIAEQLGISSGTASNWGQTHKDDIQRLRLVHMEAIQERHLKTYEEQICDLIGELKQIDSEPKLRDFGDVSTKFLLYRKDMVKLRLEKLAVSPVAITGAAETQTAAPQTKLMVSDGN